MLLKTDRAYNYAITGSAEAEQGSSICEAALCQMAHHGRNIYLSPCVLALYQQIVSWSKVQKVCNLTDLVSVAIYRSEDATLDVFPW